MKEKSGQKSAQARGRECRWANCNLINWFFSIFGKKMQMMNKEIKKMLTCFL